MDVTSQANVPMFPIQWTAAANSPKAIQQALRDSSSSSSLLLSACHEAFLKELDSLSSDELRQTNLSAADFKNLDALFTISPECRPLNLITSWTRLFLIQSFRYLAFIESFGSSPGSFASFSKFLESNSEHRIGILGFSSGMLPACVVGASSSTLNFITWAVEAFRVAFWIGIRTQIHRSNTLRKRGMPNCSSPWSRIFVGLNKRVAEEAISTFHNSVCSPMLLYSRLILSVFSGRSSRAFAWRDSSDRQRLCNRIRLPRHLGNVYRSLSRKINFP